MTPGSSTSDESTPHLALRELHGSLVTELEELEGELRKLEAKVREKRAQVALVGVLVALRPLPAEQPAGTVSLRAERSTDERDSERASTRVIDETPAVGLSRPSVLDQPIRVQQLSTRTHNCLDTAGITTIGDLARCTREDLLAIRALGAKCLAEVEAFLARLGLSLAASAESSPDPLDGDSPDEAEDPSAPRRAGATPVVETFPAASTEDSTSAIVEDVLPPEIRDLVRPALDGARQVSDTTAEALRRILRVPIRNACEEWRLDVDGVVGHASGLVDMFRRIGSGESVSFLDEVRLAINSGIPQDVAFAIRYLGLDGRETATLEEVGASFGVTRERARQRVARFTKKMLEIRPPLPLCEEAVRALADAETAIGLEEWCERLPESIRPGEGDAMLVLRELESWEWLPGNTWHLDQPVRLVAIGPDREGELAAVVSGYASAARRHLRFGTAPLLDLIESVGGSVDAARALVRADRRWTDAGYGWLSRVDGSSTTLAHQARRMIAVLGPLSVHEIRYGLRRLVRHPRPNQPTNVPPARVLRRMLERAGFSYDRGMKRLGLGQRVPQVTPRGISAAVLAAFRDGTRAITVHELDNAVAEHGLSRASARIATLRSPFLRRETYGVYSLLGHSPAPTEVADAAARLRGETASALRAHRIEGADVVLEYDLAALGSSGVLYIPAGSIDAGTWSFEDALGRTRRLRVREHFAGPADHLLAAARSRGDRSLTLRFIRQEHHIRVDSYEPVAPPSHREQAQRLIETFRDQDPDAVDDPRWSHVLEVVSEAIRDAGDDPGLALESLRQAEDRKKAEVGILQYHTSGVLQTRWTERQAMRVLERMTSPDREAGVLTER